MFLPLINLCNHKNLIQNITVTKNCPNEKRHTPDTRELLSYTNRETPISGLLGAVDLNSKLGIT
jgi:hypothetical protein